MKPREWNPSRSAALAAITFAAGALGAVPVPRANAVDAPAATPPANEIIERWIATKKSDSEMAFIKMTTSVPGAPEKEHRFLVVYRTNPSGGQSYFLRMVRPKDVEGVTVLAVNDPVAGLKQFFFLPAVGKSKDLAGGARSSAFLGSDFTYEDLLEEMPSAHTYERLEDAVVDNRKCYVVRAIESRASKSSAYAHRDLFLDQETFDLLKAEFYGPNGGKIKALEASGYRSPDVKGKTTRPKSAIMKDFARGSFTEFLVVEGRLNEKFEDHLFSTDFQEKWKPEDVEEFIFQFGMTVTLE